MPTQTHYYDVIKAESHEQLAQFIQAAAVEGWEPVTCWAHGAAAVFSHFCLLRMPAGK